MKRILSLFVALALTVGMMLSFASCGEPEDAGAEISVYLGEEIYDFDPSDYYVSSNSEQIMSLLYEPLFTLNEKGDFKYAAAERYSVNKEEREIVITLRESYWSDGVSRVTAQDFIYAWRDLVLEPSNPNPAAALLYDIENAAAIKAGHESIYSFGAVASGPYEITISYREGADYIQLLKNLASVALSPVLESAASASGDYWSKSITTIVTNGPFKIEELDIATKSFSLGRNVGYHQDPAIVDYTKNVTPASLVSFVNGMGEALSLTYNDIAEKTVFYMADAPLADKAANKSNATVADDLSTYTYVFNTDKPLFANAKVRRALSLALDRAAMAEAAVFGKAAESFVSEAVAEKLYGDLVRPLAETDGMTEAKAIIAGVNLAGLDTSFTLTVNNDEKSIALANLAKAAWAELGFNVSVDPVGTVESSIVDPQSDKNEKMTIVDSAIQQLVKDASYGVRNFDVIAVDWQMYSEDPFVALASMTGNMSGCGKNFETGLLRASISGWQNSEYDQWLTAAFMAESEEDRLMALRNAEEILLEASPIIPVLYNQNAYFASEDLSGIKVDGFGNFVLTKVSQKNYKQYLKED